MHQQQPSGPPRIAPLYTRLEAAGYLAISERKLWAVTQQGDLASIKIGRLVRYSKADLDDYIDRCRQHGTGRCRGAVDGAGQERT